MMLKRKHFYWIAGFVLAVAILSLNSSRPQGLSENKATSSIGYGSVSGLAAPQMGMMREEINDSGFAMMPPVPMPGRGGKTAAEVDQKVIKTASVSVIVSDVDVAIASISGYVTGKGGFIQNANTFERVKGKKSGSLTVRVPVTEFDATLKEIRARVAFVQSESVNGQDVTEEYSDLEAQLKNAQAQEKAYLAVLDKAKSVEDILKVQSYLGSIRQQIEQLQGRIQYLQNVTSYSTVTVAFEQEGAITVPSNEFRPLAVARESFRALIGIVQNAVESLIRLIIVGGGTMLPVLLLAFIVWKLWRRRQNNSQIRR